MHLENTRSGYELCDKGRVIYIITNKCGEAFLLMVIERGGVQVPFVNVIVTMDLLNSMPPRLKVLPTATIDGMVWYEHEKPSHLSHDELM